MGLAADLADFLTRNPRCALVEVIEAKGSTPRESGAWMLVAANTLFGTIGGGQLEWMAIDQARALLGGDQAPALMDVPLGPEIGQCCGGRVKVTIRLVDKVLRESLLAEAKAADARRPHVYLLGGGHVGHALAAALALLPVRTTVVETRAPALEGIAAPVETLLTPVPEAAIRAAPPGSAFVVLTHDHALDFLLVAEALKRGDASYVGMIGSKTKKATFRRWFFAEAGGSAEKFARLVCPIGGSVLRDKRPPVIAALAAAEIMVALGRSGPSVGQTGTALPAATSS